jgi:hypothetical protein
VNDFELHYMHTSRSRELIAEAEAARKAAAVRRDGSKREGVASRVAKALRRNEGRAPSGSRQYRLAK